MFVLHKRISLNLYIRNDQCCQNDSIDEAFEVHPFHLNNPYLCGHRERIQVEHIVHHSGIGIHRRDIHLFQAHNNILRLYRSDLQYNQFSHLDYINCY